MDNSGSLFPLFIETASGRIASLKRGLSILELEHNKEVLNQLHIDAHSLKGEALLMEYKQLGRYSTVLEKFLKQIIETNEHIPHEKHVFLTEAVSKLQETLQIIKDQKREPQELDQEADELKEKLGVYVQI